MKPLSSLRHHLRAADPIVVARLLKPSSDSNKTTSELQGASGLTHHKHQNLGLARHTPRKDVKAKTARILPTRRTVSSPTSTTTTVGIPTTVAITWISKVCTLAGLAVTGIQGQAAFLPSWRPMSSLTRGPHVQRPQCRKISPIRGHPEPLRLASVARSCTAFDGVVV